VSEITKELEDQVTSFRTRPLEEEYPFLWIDALYDKVRVEDRVVTLALMIELPPKNWTGGEGALRPTEPAP
jgi:transposase-like protein